MDIENNNTVDKNYNYADFKSRFLAYCVDYLILQSVFMVIQLLFGITPFDYFTAKNIEQFQQIQQSISRSFSSFVGVGISMIFYLIMWVNFDGATPGKRLMAIKIIKSDGSKLSYPDAFIRYIGYFISSFGFLGYLWVIWDKKKQGWHDKIADTIVVKTDKSPNTKLAVFLTLITIIITLVYVGGLTAYSYTLTMEEVKQNSRLENTHIETPNTKKLDVSQNN